ncbi:MAG: YdiU family protein [Pseudomonadales bacterium]|jgi:uncharacterized protein YdiU (UPF0061 family)|nr:YdiU family protein [Pseudomonadales bacterium]
MIRDSASISDLADLPEIGSRFTARLPGDPDTRNTRRQVFGACWSRVEPTPVAAPRTLAWSAEVAERLDLPEAFCRSQAFAEVMAGNRLLPGMDPHAMCYGGHQFGNWAGQLGDGRAINLGEIENRLGERWSLQLKGAGPTPYSRTADGRAVLRSSIREFLCSEAMHHLGVPTTRALALVSTGEQVVRDMFYDGNAAPEPGAIVCRVAPSFLRFGNFELLAARQELDLLRRLLDYTLEQDFPELVGTAPPGRDSWLALYREVGARTARMIVEWLRVGFVHGVMNTDNMSILGLTIDYGPYGWLDDYDPDWTPNTTDAAGRRYRFGHQAQIAMWNLVQLGNALYPLIGDVAPLQEAVNGFGQTFERAWQEMMAAKLGLTRFEPGDAGLVNDMQRLLQDVETDMTLFHRFLADVDVARARSGGIDDEALLAPLLPAFYADPPPRHRERLAAWLRRYVARVHADPSEPEARRAAMNRTNPLFVLRNYLAQLAIDRAEAGDPSMIGELLEVLRRPYDVQPAHADWAGRRPDWARDRAGCSMLSCSS